MSRSGSHVHSANIDWGYERTFFLCCTVTKACFLCLFPSVQHTVCCLRQACGQTCPSGRRQPAGCAGPHHPPASPAAARRRPSLPPTLFLNPTLPSSSNISRPNSPPPTPPSLLRSTPLPTPPAHLSELQIFSEAERQHWQTSGKESFFGRH